MFAFPDMNKSYNMYTTLVEEFVLHGHEVTVLAPGAATSLQKEAGIEILRVSSLPIKNVPNWTKGLSNLLLPLQFHRALQKYYPHKKYDLIISATPPVTFSGLIKRIKKQSKAHFYLILRDIFPQNAVDLGFMRKGGMAWRYFKAKEESLYKQADFIGCMSPANIQYLEIHEESLTAGKTHLLPNYQKPFKLTEAQLPESLQSLVEGKFVVIFGGNMGKPQQLENVLHLAKYASKYKDVLFLILGEGVQADKVKKDAELMGLANMHIAGTMPKHIYQQLLQKCHIGLISLNIRFTIPNIPSKALDYWNVGIPILASIDKATDFGQILDQTGTGLWAYADDAASWHRQFDRLYFNRLLRQNMAASGRSYFMKELLPIEAYNTIMNHVEAKPS